MRRVQTHQLAEREIAAIRELLWAAFSDDGEGFDEADWEHALGGLHIVLDVGGQVVAHAALVARDIRVGDRPLATGYVEAVATAPAVQRRGHGTTVMRAINDELDARYELGALGTGSHGFYERLGWQTWRGPSYVRTPGGHRATPDEDGYILVRRTPRTPPLDPGAPISCEWRPGDVW